MATGTERAAPRAAPATVRASNAPTNAPTPACGAHPQQGGSLLIRVCVHMRVRMHVCVRTCVYPPLSLCVRVTVTAPLRVPTRVRMRLPACILCAHLRRRQ
jgi:hypothetical protein